MLFRSAPFQLAVQDRKLLLCSYLGLFFTNHNVEDNDESDDEVEGNTGREGVAGAGSTFEEEPGSERAPSGSGAFRVKCSTSMRRLDSR